MDVQKLIEEVKAMTVLELNDSLDGWLGNWTVYHVQWAYCTPRGPTH